ncbi:MAG TPA: porin [Rhizomicrobium sp.]
MRLFLAMGWAGALCATPAFADSLVDWNLSPATMEMGDWTVLLGGTASGAGYVETQDGGPDRSGVTGSLLLLPRVQRELDNGWTLGAHAGLLAYHDALSGDSYGNRVLEKAYVSLDTQYGRVEAGEQDGAAYQLSVTGPRIDDLANIDNANVTFYRNPATGRAFVNLFPIRTAEFASGNFVKLTYLSPRLFDVQLGASYTPGEAHGVLPFVSSGENSADRQENLLEGAANFMQSFGAITASAYAGLVLAHDAARTPGHEGLRDWSVGGELDYDFEPVRLSIGGAWRHSNAYTFAIDESFERSSTDALRLCATAALGSWLASLEYADGRANQEDSFSGFGETGWEPSVDYIVNANLQLTLGWQRLVFKRSEGVFADGRTQAAMQAAFLHLLLKV